MKQFVQDLMGAIRIIKMPGDSPNKATLQVGDIITKVNGERIQTIPDFSTVIEDAGDRENLKVTLFRDGKELKVSVRAVDSTEDFAFTAKALAIRSCQVREIGRRALCREIKIGDFPSK